MRKMLLAGLVAATAVSVGVPLVNGLRYSTNDTEEVIWPDPRDRQGVRLQFLRSAIQRYVTGHNGVLPADLTALANSIPSNERASVAHLLVDVWGTRVMYEPAHTMFTLRSAGPDRAWRTADDLAETAPAIGCDPGLGCGVATPPRQ